MLEIQNVDALVDQFRRDRRARVQPVLKAAAAARLQSEFKELAGRDELAFTCYVDGQNLRLSRADFQSMSANERQALNQKLIDDAQKGVGFFYASKAIGPANARGPEFALDELYDFVNSEQVLDFVRTVSGDSSITSADAQLTQYTAGNYLTRHLDDLAGDRRKLAYVLSLTEHWHPDWGGLLQFYTRDGRPTESWSPGPNTLSLFDVAHVHSVTYVTPFAGAPRYSLTGWFRADE